VKNQNAIAVISIAAAYTCGTICQPNITTSVGATNLVTAAPELPAPNTPIAKPWFWRSNQRAQ